MYYILPKLTNLLKMERDKQNQTTSCYMKYSPEYSQSLSTNLWVKRTESPYLSLTLSFLLHRHLSQLQNISFAHFSPRTSHLLHLSKQTLSFIINTHTHTPTHTHIPHILSILLLFSDLDLHFYKSLI